MSDLRVRIRRVRRGDFSSAMGLLASCGLAVPAPERATLRRFRALVGDLGADFYVAEAAESIVGLVHLTYTRRLATHARAHIDLLLVDPAHRRCGVGAALMRFARRRAEKRTCAFISYDVESADAAAEGLLTRHGMVPAAAHWRRPLDFNPEASSGG